MRQYKVDPARHMQAAMDLPLEDKAATKDELDDLIQHNAMTGSMYRNVKTGGYAPYRANRCQKPSRSCDREDLTKSKVAKMLGVSAARLKGFGEDSAHGMLFMAAASDARSVFDKLRCKKGSTSGLASTGSVLIKVQAIEDEDSLRDVKNESSAQMEVYAGYVKPNAEMPTIHGSTIVPKLYFSGLINGPNPRCASWIWVMDRVSGKPFSTANISVRQYASLERSLASLWMLGYAHADAHAGNVLYDAATDHTWIIDLGEAVSIPGSLTAQLCRYYTVHTSALRAWQVIRPYVNTVRHMKARRFDSDNRIGGWKINESGRQQLYTYLSDGGLLLELWMRTTSGDIRQARFSGWLNSQTRYTSAPASVHRLIAAMKATRTGASRARKSRAPAGRARRSKSRKIVRPAAAVRKASPARAAKLKCRKDRRRPCSASSRASQRYTRKELVDTLKRCYGTTQYDRDGRRRDMDSLCRSFARLST